MPKILFSILPLLLFISSCKNPPTFTADNPYDPAGGISFMNDVRIEEFDADPGSDKIDIYWWYPDEYITGINVYHISPYDSSRTFVGSSIELYTNQGIKYGILSIPYIFDYKLTLEFEAYFQEGGTRTSGSVIEDFWQVFKSPSLIDFTDETTGGITTILLNRTNETFQPRSNKSYRFIDLDQDTILLEGFWSLNWDEETIDGETYKPFDIYDMDLDPEHEYAWQFYTYYGGKTYYTSYIELIPYEK